MEGPEQASRAGIERPQVQPARPVGPDGSRFKPLRRSNVCSWPGSLGFGNANNYEGCWGQSALDLVGMQRGQIAVTLQVTVGTDQTEKTPAEVVTGNAEHPQWVGLTMLENRKQHKNRYLNIPAPSATHRRGQKWIPKWCGTPGGLEEHTQVKHGDRGEHPSCYSCPVRHDQLLGGCSGCPRAQRPQAHLIHCSGDISTACRSLS